LTIWIKEQAGLTSKPHRAQRPKVVLRGPLCLRLASACCKPTSKNWFATQSRTRVGAGF